MIRIPKIYEKIRMAAYAPEFGEQTLSVWVNLPVGKLNALKALTERALAELPADEAGEAIALLAEIWNEDAETVAELVKSSPETDPMLLPWMELQSYKLVLEHRGRVKKNWTREFFSLPPNAEPANRSWPTSSGHGA